MTSVPSFLTSPSHSLLHPQRPKYRSSSIRVIPTCAATEAGTKTTTKRPPKHWRIPIIGILLEALFTRDFNAKLARKYGNIYRTDVPGKSVVTVTTPELISVVARSPDLFPVTGAFPQSFARLFGQDALFNLEGPHH